MNFKSQLIARLLNERTSDQTADEKVNFLTDILTTIASEANDDQLSMIASLIADDEFGKCYQCQKFAPLWDLCVGCGSQFCEKCAEELPFCILCKNKSTNS
jgi:hypothetical protein